MWYNYRIDSIKFLCSIAVVLIHLTGFIYDMGIATIQNYYIYRVFFNIAVPFYFAVSGYFLGKKINVDYYKEYAKKIYVMYIFFSILYVIFNMIFTFFDRLFLNIPFWDNLFSLLNQITVINVYKGIFGSFHLWYLAALSISVLFLILSLKIKLEASTILLVATIFYSLNTINFIDLNQIMIYGGFSKGFFYVAIGYFISRRKITIENPLSTFFVTFSIYGLSLIYSLTGIHDLLLGISVFFLMVYCDENPGKKTWLSSLGKHSLKIYVLHIFVYQFYYRILEYLGVTGYRDSILDIIITTVICVVFSIVLYKPIERLYKNVYDSLERMFAIQ